jgi:two-component system cell cycle sensor histidine kinase/response regulator CckA
MPSRGAKGTVSIGTLPRVLHIEDSADDALLLQRGLRRAGYEPIIQRVADIPVLAGALASDVWDVVVADVHVPGVEVLDVLRLVQRRGRDVPFIVVSGQVGEDEAAAILKAGAHDFVAKGELARLVSAIELERREAVQRGAERAPHESEERPQPDLEPARWDPATGTRGMAD